MNGVPGVPAPVARYLARALRGCEARITGVEIAQTGEIRLGKRWFPFRATQQFSTSPPGFAWEARVRLVPLVYVTVCDSYRNGSASMQARIFGWPFVNQSGTSELESGALHRYLGEAVWFPTSLRPGPALTWTPIDDRRALATVTDHRTRVSLEYRFDENDDVIEVFAPDRFAEVGGRYERRPWLVRCRDHQEFNGIRIPRTAEVEWQLPSGPLPYWRGTINAVRYSFDEAAVRLSA